MPGIGPRSFERLADRLDRSAGARHGLFLAAAGLSVALVGYHTGTFDQIVHLPFLRASADPTLYPGDGLVALRTRHYSFFWLALVPLARSPALEPAMAALHLAATYLTFWSLWALASTLYGRPTTALITVLVMIFPHVGFLGFPVIEFSLLNRTFVLPFLLFAVTLFLRGRMVSACLLLGLLYNLHLLSVHFALSMLLAGALVRRRQLGWRRLLTAAVAFLAAAAPVLLWKLRDGTGLDWSRRSEWVDMVCRGMLHTLCYVVDASPLVLALSAGGVASVVLYGIARRASPSRQHGDVLDAFVCVAVAILVVETLVVRLLPITWILQLQIARVCVLLLVLAYVAFGDYLATLLERGSMPPANVALLGGVLAVSTSPVAPLAAWAVLRRRPEPVPRVAVGAVPVAVFAACAALGLAGGVWSPGIHVFPRETPWVDAQLWARDHTAKDALFITPPGNTFLYTSDWRVHSERSSLASLTDLAEIALAPEYFETWRPRFESGAPGAGDRFRGLYFENAAIADEAFAGLRELDLQRVACRYGADYLVLERDRRLELPIAYENRGYRVYDLRALACRTDGVDGAGAAPGVPGAASTRGGRGMPVR